MSRSALINSVIGAFILLACGFIFVLLSSLGSKSNEPKPGVFAELVEGQTGMRRVSGQRLWITRLNIEQRDQLDASHPCKKRALCALPAATSTTGIELAFSLKLPLQLNENLPWNGGFIDPNNGNVYDLGGTAYTLTTGPKIANLTTVLVD